MEFSSSLPNLVLNQFFKYQAVDFFITHPKYNHETIAVSPEVCSPQPRGLVGPASVLSGS